MRRRFFAIILAVLSVVTAATVGIHAEFLRQERLSLIDQQVRETAAALVDSELGDLRKIDFETADEIISDELGENRFGKFFIIRDQASHKIIFESVSTKLLPILDIPESPQWLTFHGKRKLIRVLNLKLPRIPGRTLQVGLMMDEDLLAPKYFSHKTLVFLLLITSLGLLVSWFLTSTLLKPIRQLETFVGGVLPQAIRSGELPPIPAELKAQAGKTKNDEFRRLLSGLDTMIERINRSYKLSRFWAYQMAHELKTPLAILEVEIEKSQQSGGLQDSLAGALRRETARVSETVNSFLNWAELENSSQQKRLFASRVGRIVLDLQERLRHQGGDRISVKVQNDFHVLSNPQHLEQAITNLVTNALTYSAENKTVEIVVNSPTLSVSDSGLGIPEKVLERLGEPFNRGDNSRKVFSHGLGLAWVQSIARLYGWTVTFKTAKTGTTIDIVFPEDNASTSER